MNWNWIDQPAAYQWVEALCLTFVHSLWQGLLAAVLAGGILLFSRKSMPAVRYNLLAGVMLLLMGSAVLTFALVLDVAGLSGSHDPILSGQGTVQAIVQQNVSVNLNGRTSLVAELIGFFSRHAQLIVNLWFLVFAFKSLRAATGLVYLRQLSHAASAPEMRWIVRFYELAGRMQVRGEVDLAESARVTVPMVIGFLKPVVLVPLGMLASLPAGQVEAILLHELAHIRRRDYLVNLVQVFCENVFFFNPAVWWISRLIREEREHCCDDLAIGVMQNKTSFIHALVSFQEYNQSRPAFEIAFAKKRNHLLDRIKRIINNHNKPLDAMEKLFVTFSLAAALALSAATAPEKPSKPSMPEKRPALPSEPVSLPVPASPARPQAAPVLPDTLPKRKAADMEIHSAAITGRRQGISTYNVTRNNKQYEIVQRNGRMISLWVDDQEIAEADYGKYQSEIDQIMAEVKVQHERAEKERAKAEEMRKMADEQRHEAEKHREQAHEMRLNAARERVEAEKFRVEAEAHRAEADVHRKEAEVHRKEAEEHRKEAEKQRAVAEKEREAFEKIQEGIIQELISAGVVKDRESLSYRLSADELVVNGTKQPAELHQKIKSKYVQQLGDQRFELLYNYSGNNGFIRTGRQRD